MASKGEGEGLVWGEVDEAGGALRLRDSKEGVSVRPLGRAALDALPARPGAGTGSYVFPGRQANAPYGSLPGPGSASRGGPGWTGRSPCTPCGTASPPPPPT
ncbi:MAG TPA: hypothetical protein VIL69_12105 [Roseomonas sp.]|jgi:hypothetical protein